MVVVVTKKSPLIINSSPCCYSVQLVVSSEDVYHWIIILNRDQRLSLLEINT